MARGNQGQKICADDGDRQMWVATLAGGPASQGFETRISQAVRLVQTSRDPSINRLKNKLLDYLL